MQLRYNYRLDPYNNNEVVLGERRWSRVGLSPSPTVATAPPCG